MTIGFRVIEGASLEGKCPKGTPSYVQKSVGYVPVRVPTIMSTISFHSY